MASYYYLISSLPMLKTQGEPPMDYGTFLDMCKAAVGSGVYNQRLSGSSPISTVFSARSDANIPVLLTNRSLAENNIIVGVDENRFEDAIRAIYSSFVK